LHQAQSKLFWIRSSQPIFDLVLIN